jgi:hypothetical protein
LIVAEFNSRAKVEMKNPKLKWKLVKANSILSKVLLLIIKLLQGL